MVNEHNGIEIYDNAFDDEYCSRLLDFFADKEKTNNTYLRPEERLVNMMSKDSSTNLTGGDGTTLDATQQALINEFDETFWSVHFKDYLTKYPLLSQCAEIGLFEYKLQKTNPEEGYHVWHFELGGFPENRRILTYIYYLNDVDEGGETELLYLRKRVKAKRNRLVIFPATYLYTHRGNPPLSDTKYIMTGWLNYL